MVTTGGRGSKSSSLFFGGFKNFVFAECDVLHFELELACNDRGGVEIDRLVHVGHGSHAHEFLDHIPGLDAHLLGEFGHLDGIAHFHDAFMGCGHGDLGLLHVFAHRSLLLFRNEDHLFFPVIGKLDVFGFDHGIKGLRAPLACFFLGHPVEVFLVHTCKLEAVTIGFETSLPGSRTSGSRLVTRRFRRFGFRLFDDAEAARTLAESVFQAVGGECGFSPANDGGCGFATLGFHFSSDSLDAIAICGGFDGGFDGLWFCRRWYKRSADQGFRDRGSRKSLGLGFECDFRRRSHLRSLDFFSVPVTVEIVEVTVWVAPSESTRRLMTVELLEEVSFAAAAVVVAAGVAGVAGVASFGVAGAARFRTGFAAGVAAGAASGAGAAAFATGLVAVLVAVFAGVLVAAVAPAPVALRVTVFLAALVAVSAPTVVDPTFRTLRAFSTSPSVSSLM